MSPPPPPILSPANRVRVNGVEAPALTATIIDFVVDDQAGGRATCQIAFLDWGPTSGGTGFLHVDRSLLDLQVPIAIDIGQPGAMAVVFEGRITAIDGRFDSGRLPWIVVTAEALASLRAVPRTRQFQQMSCADTVQAIASEHGLEPVVRLVASDVPTTRRQSDETDLAFIIRQARALGADTWLDGSHLHVHDRQARVVEPIVIDAGATLLESSVSSRALSPTSARSTSQVDMLVDGDAPIRVGAIVQLTGVGPLHEGRYLVSRATHTFDRQHGLRVRASGARV